MDELKLLRSFQAVAQSASFALAARQLDVSASQITRDVKQLEASLGARLLNRSTRKVALTPAGINYLEGITPALKALEDASQAARASTQSASGKLRVSAPVSLGERHLGEAIGAFLQEHPTVQIDVALNDQFEDIAESGMDVAIRVASSPSPMQISRILAHASLGLFASKGYIARFGMPSHPRDIRPECCYYYSNAPSERWPLSDGLTVPVTGCVSANNGELLAHIAVATDGIVYGPYFSLGTALERGELVPVLKDFWPEAIAVYAVMASHRFQPARVTAFCDFLVKYWGPRPPWEKVESPILANTK